MSKEPIKFNDQYLKSGRDCQRTYPNESLVGFIKGNFGGLSPEEKENTKILELGCGSGANLPMIAKEGHPPFGIDFSPAGIDVCREVMEEEGIFKADLLVGDMTDLPYDDNCFDAIFDVVSMQHIGLEAHVTAYREVYRCLKPGGKFFSYHLGAESITYRHSKPIDKTDPYTRKEIEEGYPLAGNPPICYLTHIEARRLLSQEGFQNVKVNSVRRGYKEDTQFMEYLIITAYKELLS